MLNDSYIKFIDNLNLNRKIYFTNNVDIPNKIIPINKTV